MHRQQYLVAPAAPPQPIPLPRMMHPTPGAYAHQHIPNDQSPSQSPTSAEAGPSSATLTPNGAPYNSPANLASQNSVMSTNDDSSNRSAARRPAVRRRTNGDDTRSESSSATSHIPKTRDGPKKKKAARACASCQKAHLTCDDCTSFSLSPSVLSLVSLVIPLHFYCQLKHLTFLEYSSAMSTVYQARYG